MSRVQQQASLILRKQRNFIYLCTITLHYVNQPQLSKIIFLFSPFNLYPELEAEVVLSPHSLIEESNLLKEAFFPHLKIPQIKRLLYMKSIYKYKIIFFYL